MAGSRKVIHLVGAPSGPTSGAVRREASPIPETTDGESPEEELVRRLCAGDSWGERTLLERYTGHVERILVRILGGHPDLDDLTQEVFVRAFDRLDELRDPPALRRWLTAIAVFVAREAIRKKRRRRWLVFLPAETTPEIEIPAASLEARAALRTFYEVVASLPTDRRIAFTLRFVEGMELTEIADVCDVSLATIKRRIKSAELDFYARGMARAELADWFEEGTRWP
jgi:RNA polymerase sigma-70 factor (ECF subfamily)